MDANKVLEAYRDADDGKRLSLFLAYRELREQFSAIEQKTAHEDFSIFKFRYCRKRRDRHAA